MRIGRRQAIAAIGTAAGAAALGGCSDLAPPVEGRCPGLAGRRLRWIVPHAAGGGYDRESRLLAGPLERRLGAAITIENQAGAGGLVGARAIASASPDGLTLGMIGVPGLLMSALLGRPGVPNPASDFTILGRVSRSWQVWAAGPRAPEGLVPDLAAAARPLVFAVSQASSPNIVGIAGAAALLGAHVELVAGFAGTRGACLAAIRGDVDLVCFNYETIRPFIRSGELRPVLQISGRRVASDPVLDGVALLGGGAGAAVRRARHQGGDVDRAGALAAALERVVGGGRLVVGPAGLPSGLTSCLDEVIHAALVADVGGHPGARIDPAPAAEAAEDVRRAAADAPAFLDVVRPLVESLRR